MFLYGLNKLINRKSVVESFKEPSALTQCGLLSFLSVSFYRDSVDSSVSAIFRTHDADDLKVSFYGDIFFHSRNTEMFHLQ